MNAVYTGTAENEIRRNEFNDQRTANAAFGQNGNDEYIDEFLATGLQFLCNENMANMNDMFITALSSSNDQGVRLFQGAPGQSTLNELSQNLQPSGFHFTTNDQQNLKYYWSGAIGEPINFNGNFSKVLTSAGDECPSIFGGVVMLNDNDVLTNEVSISLNDELSTVSSDFNDLKDVFTIKLLAGDASSLHASVTGLTISNRSTVKQDLLDESPYLSIGLLTELGNVSSNIFPHEWFQEIIEANAEVMLDNNFRSFLKTKTDPMPTAIYDSTVVFAQNNSTQRGLDMAEIGVQTTRMAEIENVLLADLIQSEELTDQNNIPVSILKRNNYMKRAELIDHYLAKGDVTAASNQIDLLEQEFSAMPNEKLNTELEDFIKLKEYLMDHLNVGNTLDNELTQANIDFLVIARDTYTGRASYQASNILCFYADMCENMDPMNLATIGRTQGENSGQSETITVLEDKGDFVLYPNPNEGTFVIKGKNKAEIKRVEIRDIQGKTMAFEVMEINDETVQIDFNSAKRGIYIVQIWSIDDTVQNIRILKN